MTKRIFLFVSILSILLTPGLLQAQTAADADFDGSGTVDFPDFIEFAKAFGTSGAECDLNGNGTVDFPDFLAFVKLFGQKTYSISGQIMESGTGLSGVTLILKGSVEDTVTTGADGSYSFPGLPDGSCAVTPVKAGYTFSPDSLNVTLSSADVVGQDFAGTKTIMPTGGGGEAITETLPGADVAMEFVYIEPGTFMMGSPDSEERRSDDEGPQHEVTITKGFYLGKYEVTQGQWQAVMGTIPWSGQSYVQANPDHPAVYVSWEDAQAFIQKLNEAAGKTLYGLPTEAEWEYACRAGTTTRWSFGDDESRLGEYAWYGHNAWDAGEQYAHMVGTKKPSPWGLYDMHGNVREWCQDWFELYSNSAQVDPVGPSRSSSYRVFRGGAFNFSVAARARSASRHSGRPAGRPRLEHRFPPGETGQLALPAYALNDGPGDGSRASGGNFCAQSLDQLGKRCPLRLHENRGIPHRQRALHPTAPRRFAQVFVQPGDAFDDTHR